MSALPSELQDLASRLAQGTDGTSQASMASSTPPFDPSGTRYDQKTYAGRLAHFREMVSPSTLFVSDAELAAKSELLERHARGAAPEASDAELWDAKRIKDAVIHPVTGEKMFLPGRMSAFVPQHGRCQSLAAPTSAAAPPQGAPGGSGLRRHTAREAWPLTAPPQPP